VHTGEQLRVTNPIAQEYKLEIIAESDGHKDYTTLNSKSPYHLGSISPNPASNQVQVDFNVKDASSAYIMITSTQTAVSNNYILDISQSKTNINISNYIPSTYVLSLVCNGEIVESKNLVIQ